MKLMVMISIQGFVRGINETKIGKSWYLIVVEDMTDENYDVISDNSCPEISHAKLRSTYIQIVSQWFLL